MLHRISVACNLVIRSVFLDSSLCRFCQKEDEEVCRVFFFTCEYAIEVCKWFCSWVGLQIGIPHDFSSLTSTINSMGMDKK